MPRLIDDIRAVGRPVAPFFIQPDKLPQWRDYARVIWDLMSDPEMPILAIDNISNYYFWGSDQERWDLTRDFPNLTPSERILWMEHRLPPAIHSKEKGLTNVRRLTPSGRVGMLVYSCKPEDIKGEGITEAVRLVLWCDLFIDYGLPGRAIEGPHGAMFYALDEHGSLIDRAWMQTYSDPKHNEHMKTLMIFFHPGLLAISYKNRGIKI